MGGGGPPPQQPQLQPQQGPITYMVTVPAGVSSGMQFMVSVEGKNMSEFPDANFRFSFLVFCLHR